MRPLPDYPGVSRMQTESPALPYKSPNLSDKTNKSLQNVSVWHILADIKNFWETFFLVFNREVEEKCLETFVSVRSEIHLTGRHDRHRKPRKKNLWHLGCDVGYDLREQTPVPRDNLFKLS